LLPARSERGLCALIIRQFVLTPSSAKLDVVKSSALVKAVIQLPGGETAVYNASGLKPTFFVPGAVTSGGLSFGGCLMELFSGGEATNLLEAKR
jgi:hypothetical protein